VGAAGLVVLIATIGILGVIASPRRVDAPLSQPTFTYTGAWDLLQLQRHIDAGEVVAVTPEGQAPDKGTDDSVLLAKLRDGQVMRVVLDVTGPQAMDALANLGHGDLLTTEAWQAVKASRATQASGTSEPLRTILAVVFPLALVAILAILLMRVLGRQGSGPRDTASRFTTILPTAAAKGEGAAAAAAAVTDRPSTGVRLADVAGCDEAKVELTETISFLKDPERFLRLGARSPRGIMLYGPPGTGKTMLAKAVAAEAGVPFLYASGSEFVEKYVGVGARRIRDLFAQARKHGRAVIFFDEFDAIGKARGGQNSHEEREQTLNQLLVELDGFSTNDDVVVIAATNRLDVLDSAVLRPGRFTRKINVPLPDVKGRREILDVHARDKPLAVTADLDGLARKTYGFSGAMLADLLNEAAILAARREADSISPDDLHNGWLKVAVGSSRRRSMDERERSIIAAHEVGHAICGRIHGDRRKIEEISLFAHGEALGVTVSSQEDNDLPAESDLRARLVALMGGRAAEELLFHEVTGGASNDFEKANQIATTMVTKFGMGRDPEAKEHGTSGRGSLSFLVARPNGGLPSEVQAAATRAIRGILDTAYEEAMETLIAHMATLRRIAAYLVEHERVDGETFEALFDGRVDVAAAEGEWRPETARPRDWADIVPFRELRGRGPVAVPSPSPVAADAPAPIPLPLPSVAVEAPGLGELADEPGATGAATIGADLTEPLADSIATSSAAVIEEGVWAATPLVGEPAPAIAATTPGKARRVKAASKVARALGGPTGRRVRRLTAGLLASAEARIRPVESEPER
jgi:cell division protease FtsH